MTIDSIPVFLPHIKSGALRALAVTSPERSPVLPDVPPISDLFSGFDASPMNYVAARAATPGPIVERLNKEINAVLTMPEIRERLLAIGVTPTGSTTGELEEQIKREAAT